MFLGLGVGAFSASVFHVLTHAFFKALLFLGAGSVIHGLSGEQDIRKMGGLKSKMPITFITFLLACLAISGIPGFSGFFSKDAILAHAFEQNPILWLLGLLGSMFTAFYMFRLLYLVFYGQSRVNEAVHPHESPKVMTIPLIILAILSVIGGYIGIPESLGGTSQIDKFLNPVFTDAQARLNDTVGQAKLVEAHGNPMLSEVMLMTITTIAVLISIFLAWQMFLKQKKVPQAEEVKLGPVQNLLYHKYYVDELYATVITRPLDKFSEWSEKNIESGVIDKTVNSSGRLIEWMSSRIRFLQTGNVGFYLFAMVLGIVFILLINLL
jgi:NADH-quinone oxidoreductase subunit L